MQSHLHTKGDDVKTVTLDLEDDVVAALREQVGEPDDKPTPDDPMVGGKWFIRTVTFHLIGKVVRRSGLFLVLQDASWVADSGRFMQAIKNGTLSEVEPVGDAIVGLASIVDAFPWKHALPKDQK